MADVSIFTPTFLQALQIETDGSAGATLEAETAGPWEVRPDPEHGWIVGAAEDPEIELEASEHEVAFLAAAALPGTGRDSFFQILNSSASNRYLLVTPDGTCLGRLRHFNSRLADAMHTMECLRRDPLSLARFLHTARGAALARAGRLLWIWQQAPPRI